ncbi:MAG: glycerophosphodiester phosphodiesterase [Phyllobacteriaceae bacterium]|nr:glycerophosphodiester phosphodiesterase [Phyllobacteriaceae bacterium]
MDFSWLTRRPIAHRGLHDARLGRIENTLGAARAAVDRGFSIECDVSLSADDEVVVFHDDTLERLTVAEGRVGERRFAELAGLTMRGGAEHIPSLGQLLAAIDGRVGLVIELKSAFKPVAEDRLAARVAEVLAGYDGPVVTKSFDPRLVVSARRYMPDLAHGIVAERADDPVWYGGMSAVGRFALTHLLHAPWSRPDFVSYSIRDLPAPGPWALRRLFGRPVITWTVSSPADAAKAALHADQIVFEGFDPEAAAQ